MEIASIKPLKNDLERRLHMMLLLIYETMFQPWSYIVTHNRYCFQQHYTRHHSHIVDGVFCLFFLVLFRCYFDQQQRLCRRHRRGP